MGSALLIVLAIAAEPAFSVDQQAGKAPAVLLHFGASWCAPCIAELPWIAELDQRYRARGLVSVLVAEDEEMKKLAAERGISFPVVFDRGGALGDRYGVKNLPHLIALDGSGAIAVDQEGLKASVQKEVETFLARTFPEERASGDREEEVTFEEEVDRESLKTLPPIPEYRYSRWLLGLPVGCALLVAWNVDWRGKSRRIRKERRK